MFVTYKPEDGDVQDWEFRPNKVRQSEGEMIEKRFGGTWDQFVGAVQSGNLKARRVLLWHLMRRQHPALRLEDVPDFYTGEVEVRFSHDELLTIREKALKATLNDADREQIETALDIEITEAIARESAEGKAQAKLEKAPSKSAG